MEGDLDYGTNYMGVKAGGDPNIFETEIHGGIYRGTILIELDRVGCGEGFGDKVLPHEEKAKRGKGITKRFENLWSTGRQSRFSCRYISKVCSSSLYVSQKSYILRECKSIQKKVDLDLIKEVLKDYSDVVLDSVIVAVKIFVDDNEEVVSIGEAFDKMAQWVDEYYMGE